MKPFLEHVAEDMLAKYGEDLSRIAVVFPNKRASLFLNEHLARLSGKPIWSPSYITISDLFRSHSARSVADPIKLVCDLHRSFTAVTGIDETLDHFYGWGQLLLSDFDDIDKQMADADRVFANLTDLHQMDDDSFLTDEQRQVLKRFFSNFSEEHNSELRQRFLRLWSKMGDIYHDYNDRLRQQGLAYEGALYREVVSTDDLSFPNDVYLFVGFNVLLNVEQRLFNILRRQQKARFYWDFDHYYMGSHNEAGHFISQYLSHFPNELDSRDGDIYDNFRQPKAITIASATSENIQARYAASWLQQNGRISDGRRTAIVLCNEGLLPVIIHCLPGELEAVNVTTGFSLAQAPVATLIERLVSLRRDGYDSQRGSWRLRQVAGVLSHPYIAAADPQMADLRKKLTEEHVYYPTGSQLSTDALTTLLFQSPEPAEPHSQLSRQEELLSWLCNVMQAIAKTDTASQDVLRQESIFRAYTLLNRLLNLTQSGDLDIDIITLGRLVNQLMQTATVPFHGEPAEGLQVMGVLETRNLDFDHVLMLSASEGNMPRGVSDTSFIPYNLRRAYGLTTPDHKVAIYSYYFNRLLQRAGDITLVYNNATSDGQKGEMSRFLLQLMVESPHPVELITLQGGQEYTPRQPQAVENRALMPPLLSPTAINRYLTCPLKYHYQYVCQLREPDEEDDETIDGRLFGTIFHEASRIVYSRLMRQDGQIVAEDIDRLLKSKIDIERAVDEAFRQELFHLTEHAAMPPLNGLQLINREVIIHYLSTLLAIDRQLTPFTILKLEEDVSMQLTLPSNETVTIGGRIDRMDLVTDGNGQERIRVIDYKTGAHRLNALPDVDAIFEREKRSSENDYYLQAMLYSMIVARKSPQTPVAPALFFVQHAGVDNYDPTLLFDKEPIDNVLTHADRFSQLLAEVVATMFDHGTPLSPTTNSKTCEQCPFHKLCY